MKPGGWTFTGWALAISAGLGAILVALIFYLDARVGAQQELYTQATEDYKAVSRLRVEYRELEIRKSKMPPDQGQAAQSWPVFLTQKASEAGLPPVNITPENPGRGALKEISFTVSLDGGSQSVIPRRQFVRFLDLVETQRPGFKSKTINLKFSATQPDDLSRAVATFSHFER